jgi:hypothetical protein
MQGDKMSDREPDIEEQVRQRAYELWEEAGRPEGRGDEFWHEAWTDITSGSEPVATATIGATASGDPPSKEGRSKSAEPTS